MRSGSATELSAYTYQRAIKLTPFGSSDLSWEWVRGQLR